MNPILIIVVFFVILAVLIYGAAMGRSVRKRLSMASAAFIWSFFMFKAASWAETLNYNIWYSGAAARFLDASIEGIEEGRSSEVLIEMKNMRKELHPTYESQGNFKELANGAAKRLKKNQTEQGGASDR